MRRFLMDRLARPAVLPMALVVALTLICAQRTYAVSLTPNASIISYNFAGNGELLFALPVRNQPVHLMANCTTVGTRGIAFVDIMSVSVAPVFIMWSGQHSAGAGAGANTSGFSAANEVTIADVDFSGTLELEVASGSSLAVSNESGAARAGLVTMIW